MKKFIGSLLILLFALLPFVITAQQKSKAPSSPQTKVHVVMVKNENGIKMVVDTSFVPDDNQDVNELVKQFLHQHVDSAGKMKINVGVSINTDTRDSLEKEIIIVDKTDDMHHPGRKLKWISEDGKEHVFVLSANKDAALQNLDERMEILHEKLGEAKKRLEKQKMIFMDKNGNQKAFFENLSGLHNRFVLKDDRVSDKELRDAGIKNKPDRLNLKAYNLNMDNGKVRLSFELESGASPKVVVYNYFGERVFSGNPHLTNGVYELSIDLSQKQYGTYYLQIIRGRQSVTKRLRLHP